MLVCPSGWVIERRAEQYGRGVMPTGQWHRSELVGTVDGLMRRRGATTIQLELLVPKGWEHPNKRCLREILHKALAEQRGPRAAT